jgi:DNA polymerase (family 10)
MSLNHELSEIFKTMAAVMEIKGEPVFKSIAFSKVSRLLKDMTFDIRQAHTDGTLKNMEGVGPASRKIIEEYITTGRSTAYEELTASVPAGLLPLLEIPGLGPKTIALFWKQRGITNLAELVKALDEGTLKGLPGIGDKKLAAIREGIQLRSQAAERMNLAEAFPIAESLLERLRALPGVKQAEIAGSLRRGRETIGDVDLVCCLASKTHTENAQKISETFTTFPEVTRILGQGTTKASVLTAGGLQVDLRIVPQDNFGAALLYFTGSKDHNVKIRGLALDKGMTLNEWGLYKLEEYEKADKKTAEAPPIKPVAAKTEADVYKKLGLAYVEPELREDRGEIDAARARTLPDLITAGDIKGDLHTHTTASDGVNTIEEMAAAAKELGYEYLAITDHSKSQVIANGLSPERLLAHVAAIRKAADRVKGITLLAGAEVDILADGTLDYEPAILAELDIVVASPHIALKQDEAKATDRIRRAIDARYVNIIGHPTGRIINSRTGLPLNFQPLFQLASSNGTALEINCGSERLDLCDIHARAALQSGCLLSINTDAHAADEFRRLRWGITVARRAWTTRDRVVNCLSLKELRSFIQRKR